MISNSTFHGSTSIVMLNPKSDVWNQSSIVFRYRTLNLRIKVKTQTKIETNFPQNEKKKWKTPKKKSQTLISLNGIIRLLSIFESKPRIRDAWRKFLFVAAKAFIVSLKKKFELQRETKINKPKIQSDRKIQDFRKLKFVSRDRRN